MKLKKGDKVIWKKFITPDGKVLPLAKISVRYKKVIESKEVLTIKGIELGEYKITKSGFEDEGFFEGELELNKVTNWKKQFEG